MVVRRYWSGRSFCYSEIMGKNVYLTGYVWYGGRRPTHDSYLHKLVDYVARDILKEATGKTTGEAEIPDEVVRKHLEEIREYVEKVKGRSWRASMILQLLNKKSDN